MSIKKNTLINIVSALVPMVLMLATIPLYLKLLGNERFGILSLVWLFLGYFSFADMGFGKALTNQIAKIDENDDEARSEIFWSSFFFIVIVGFVFAIILDISGKYYFLNHVQVDSEFRKELKSVIPWLSVVFPVSLLSSVLIGSLEGRHKFVEVGLLQLVGNTLFQIFPLIAAHHFSASLQYVIPAALIGKVITNVLLFWFCYRLLPIKNFSFGSMPVVKKLLSYGGWVSVTNIVGTLLETVERIILGSLLGGAAVTKFSIPMQVIGKMKIVPGSLSKVLFPRFSEMQVEKSRILAIDSTRELSCIMAILCISMAFFVKPFFEFWIKDSSDLIFHLSLIFISGVWFNAVSHISYFLMQANGRPDAVAKIHICELPIYIVFCVIAIKYGGLEWLAIVWSAKCIFESILMVRLAGIGAEVVRNIWPNLLILHIVILCLYIWGGEIKTQYLFLCSFIPLVFGTLKYRKQIFSKLKIGR